MLRLGRVTIDGETTYHIRSIPHLYVVGQTYPQTEVPGPHSRKVTTLQKNRLMTIAFKLVAKNKDSRIKVHRLTRYFPDHNDLQMRQKLKVSSSRLRRIVYTGAILTFSRGRNSWSSSARATTRASG